MKYQISIAFLLLSFSLRAQTAPPVYHINPWVSGGIITAGAGASLAAWRNTFHKPEIDDSEFTYINKNNVSKFDSWALSLALPQDRDEWEVYATLIQSFTAALPFALSFDKRMQHARLDLLLLYLETSAITITFYQIGPLGPLFHDRYRPVVYYDTLSREVRDIGYNRNSFYSGHVAFAASCSFFLAKVYSDYHPELEANKYLVFGAALIPPLVMGYIRLKELMHFPSDILVGLGVGALCGIVVPEIHRLVQRNISSEPSARIVPVQWSFGIVHEGTGWSFFIR